MPELPIFLQAGYPRPAPYGTVDPVMRANYQSFISELWTYLDSQVTGNNGEVLVIGDQWLPKAAFGGDVFDIGTALGWPVRLATHDTGSGLEDRGLAAVLDELAAGTYVPRLIYVEDISDLNGYGPALTGDQYLFLRSLAETGTTALHLQVSEGISAGGVIYNEWVEALSDGQLKLAWTDQEIIAAAGGYPPFSAGTDWSPYKSVEHVAGTPLEMLPPITRMGWGWFVPQGMLYEDFMAAHAIIVPDRDYTDLPDLPGTVRPITAILGLPLANISGRLRDVRRHFVSPTPPR